jgi:hypothetical protein
MQVGEEKEHRENVIFLSVNEMANDDIIDQIKKFETHYFSAQDQPVSHRGDEHAGRERKGVHH